MTIVIYTSDRCPHCDALKAYLSEKQMPYTEHNILNDLSARMELIRRNILAVPVIFIDEQVIVGFNLHKIDETLQK